MAELPYPDIELPGVDQVGFVVEDIQDGMDRFFNIFGVEPWEVHRFEPPDLVETTYYGEPEEYGMVLAIAHAGDTMLELIQPTMGRNIYTDFLMEHGEGIHHLAYFSWDEERTYEVVEQLENAGMPVIQSGTYAGTEFWYFDTAAELNGLVFETAIRRNIDSREPERVYPE